MIRSLRSQFVWAALCFGQLADATLAEERGKLLFKDDFERNESQELSDEVGNGWATNSKSRAAGNKQVDLRDGAMHIFIHEAADHAVSVTHPAEFKDGSVELRFMLEHKDDSLGLNFADLQYKEVWAGHLFVAKVSTKEIELTDLKTGNMDLKTRELRLAKKAPTELLNQLKTKTKKFTHSLETNKWYSLKVDIQGDKLRLEIDGKELAAFASEGISHPTKRTLRLAVPRNAVVDDIQVFAIQ